MSLSSNEQAPKVPSSRPKKATSKQLETDNAPVIPSSRPSKRVATIISAGINEAKNDIHSLKNDTGNLDISSTTAINEMQTQCKTTQQDNDQSDFDSSIPSHVVEGGNDLVKNENIVANASQGDENRLDDHPEEDSLSSPCESQNTLTAGTKIRNKTLPDVTNVEVAHNHKHDIDSEYTDCYTEVERNSVNTNGDNTDLDGFIKTERGLKLPNKESHVVEPDSWDTSKRETQKAKNKTEANDILPGAKVDDIIEKEEEDGVDVVDNETEQKEEFEKEIKKEIKEKVSNVPEVSETKFEGRHDETIPKFYEEKETVRTTNDDGNHEKKGSVLEETADYDNNVENVVTSEEAENQLPDNQLEAAINSGDEIPLKKITSHQQRNKTIDNDKIESGLSDSNGCPEITETRNIAVDEKCISAAPSEKPELPKFRPKNNLVTQSLDSTSATKKAPPPKVPKKPSSKIAAFQEMLQQQQSEELGLLNKTTPKIPWKRPIVTSTTNESNLKTGSPDEPIKTVNRVQSDFAHNLNGLLGVGLPGISLGTKSFESSKHVKEGPSEDNLGNKKEFLRVPDARRSRARGPRGRKLPEEVKKPVEVTNETLGNTLRITIQPLWSIDFGNITDSSEIEESVDSHTCYDEVIPTQLINDDVALEQQTEESVENHDSEEIASEPISGENLVTVEATGPVSAIDEDIEKVAKEESIDHLNTPNTDFNSEITDRQLKTLDKSSNEPDHVISECMESLSP